MSDDELIALDKELTRLSRGAGAMRLAIGRGLAALARRGGHHELGFSSLEAYAWERVERAATWTRESRALAERLETLPRVRAAVESGHLSWTLAKVVAKALSKTASPEEEVAWLTLAQQSTVRQLQETVREAENPTTDNVPETAGDRFTTLSITMTREELALFECARMVVTRVSGWRALHLVMDALVDEGTSSLVVPAGARRTPYEEEELTAKAQRAYMAQHACFRTEAERLCEDRLREQPKVMPEAFERVDFEGDGFETIDAKLRKLARELATRDVSIGRLANRFYAADG